MSNPLSPPVTPQHNFRRIAILFAGGPAPAANAVISTCAASYDAGVEVLGLLNGYSRLVDFKPERPLEVMKRMHTRAGRAGPQMHPEFAGNSHLHCADQPWGKKVEHPSH